MSLKAPSFITGRLSCYRVVPAMASKITESMSQITIFGERTVAPQAAELRYYCEM
jgi:hypothetical protein